MDLKNKERPKKRKLRRNLDESRKTSRSEVKRDVTPRRNSTTKHENTSNRLTLPFLNKTITSKIITRAPFANIDIKDEVKAQNNEAVCNILSTSNQYQNLGGEIGTSKINTTGQQKNNCEIGKKYINSEENVSDTIVDSGESHSISLLSPSEQDFEDSSYEETSNGFNYMRRLPSNRQRIYEEFMSKVLPNIFSEEFPTLKYSKGDVEDFLHPQYLENEFQENEGPGESIIENPMNYIQTGRSRDSLSSSSSSSVSHLPLNSTDIFQNSPEYQYFPHKLNQ